MTQLVSSDLPVGYTGAMTADQMNRLRDDLLIHHDHSSGKGGTVGHGNTEDAAIDDTYLTHVNLNKHVQGTGVVEGGPDNPGGSAGVHGLGTTSYVWGNTKRQLVCQIGTGTTDRGGDEDDDPLSQRGRGTFGTAFAEPPELVWCLPNVGQAACVSVYQRLATSFAVRFRFRDESTYSDGNQHNIPFLWIAFGVIEE